MPKTLKSRMKPNDVHIVVNAVTHQMTCYTYTGEKKWTIEAHCEGVNGPGFDRAGGDTPPGVYEIGLVTKTQRSEPDSVWYSYGRYFCDLVELENQEASRGRAGVGVHSAGTGLPDPMADYQGWAPTLGCVRLQNFDQYNTFVPMVKWVKSHGGKVYVEVCW